MKSYCLCLDHRRSCEDVSSRGIYQLNFDSNKFKVSLKVITLWAELKLHFVIRYGTDGRLRRAFQTRPTGESFCWKLLSIIYLFIYLSSFIPVCLFILFIIFCLVIRCSLRLGLPLCTNKCPGEWPSTFLVDLAREEGSWTGEEAITIQARENKGLAWETGKQGDLIDHNILVRKLSDYDIPNHILCWIADFLLDRRQRVKLAQGCFSEWR